ncbi:MAG: hypothetical protein CM15mP102_21250 [Flavobacteriales bacterium]|nr:MAG: hypothetical protein CM15mP102_21250 [Flavobacteriales bacterium]
MDMTKKCRDRGAMDISQLAFNIALTLLSLQEMKVFLEVVFLKTSITDLITIKVLKQK